MKKSLLALVITLCTFIQSHTYQSPEIHEISDINTEILLEQLKNLIKKEKQLKSEINLDSCQDKQKELEKVQSKSMRIAFILGQNSHHKNCK